MVYPASAGRNDSPWRSSRSPVRQTDVCYVSGRGLGRSTRWPPGALPASAARRAAMGPVISATSARPPSASPFQASSRSCAARWRPPTPRGAGWLAGGLSGLRKQRWRGRGQLCVRNGCLLLCPVGQRGSAGERITSGCHRDRRLIAHLETGLLCHSGRHGSDWIGRHSVRISLQDTGQFRARSPAAPACHHPRRCAKRIRGR
jgi:hypothetical protein